MEDEQNKTFTKLEINYNQNKENNSSLAEKVQNEKLNFHNFNHNYVSSYSFSNYPNPYNYYMYSSNFHLNNPSSFNNQNSCFNKFPREPMNFHIQNYYSINNNMYLQKEYALIGNNNQNMNRDLKDQYKNKIEDMPHGYHLKKKETNPNNKMNKETKINSPIIEQTSDNNLKISSRKRRKKKNNKKTSNGDMKDENKDTVHKSDIKDKKDDNNNDNKESKILLINKKANKSNNSNENLKLNKASISKIEEMNNTEDKNTIKKTNFEIKPLINKKTEVLNSANTKGTKIKSSKCLVSNLDANNAKTIKKNKISEKVNLQNFKNNTNTNTNNIQFDNPSNFLSQKAPSITGLYKNFEEGFNPNARFFIMKSSDEDNIYKSIKYRVWCSSFTGNKILNEAFKNAKNEYPIYLIFSVNRSGRFVGICQMISEVNLNSTFVNWNDSEKYRGYFFVVWVSVKDVPSALFANIFNKLNSNESVIRSRNNQEIDAESGFGMLRIFRNHPLTSSILDDLIYFEMKENNKLASINNIDIMDKNNNNQIPNNYQLEDCKTIGRSDDKLYECENDSYTIKMEKRDEEHLVNQ